MAKFWIIVTSQILKKVIYSKLSAFKAGDFERMRVVSNGSFFAGKFPEMQVTSAQCRWVHIYVFNFYKQGFALKKFPYLGEETTNWNKKKTHCRVISKTSVAITLHSMENSTTLSFSKQNKTTEVWWKCNKMKFLSEGFCNY